MKNTVLLELAKQWEHDAITPECQDGSKEAELSNAKDQGARESKRACADALKMLCSMLSDHGTNDQQPTAKQ